MVKSQARMQKNWRILFLLGQLFRADSLHLWHFSLILPGGIVKALYQITSSLEHVFNNMFKLFGSLRLSGRPEDDYRPVLLLVSVIGDVLVHP